MSEPDCRGGGPTVGAVFDDSEDVRDLSVLEVPAVGRWRRRARSGSRIGCSTRRGDRSARSLHSLATYWLPGAAKPRSVRVGRICCGGSGSVGGRSGAGPRDPPGGPRFLPMACGPGASLVDEPGRTLVCGRCLVGESATRRGFRWHQVALYRRLRTPFGSMMRKACRFS